MNIKSTTLAGTGFCNSLNSIMFRPPLLQKEGRVIHNELQVIDPFAYTDPPANPF